MSTVTIYKRNHQGETIWQYKGVVVDRGETWMCISALFERSEADLGFVIFRRGDVFTEWFYTDRWYNVFRVEDGQDGQLKGWYCNITRPAAINDESIRADDLALDVFVFPNGNILLLDEEEFDLLDLPIAERIAALRAVEAIRAAVSQRAAPFSEIRTGSTDRLR